MRHDVAPAVHTRRILIPHFFEVCPKWNYRIILAVAIHKAAAPRMMMEGGLASSTRIPSHFRIIMHVLYMVLMLQVDESSTSRGRAMGALYLLSHLLITAHLERVKFLYYTGSINKSNTYMRPPLFTQCRVFMSTKHHSKRASRCLNCSSS